MLPHGQRESQHSTSGEEKVSQPPWEKSGLEAYSWGPGMTVKMGDGQFVTLEGKQ